MSVNKKIIETEAAVPDEANFNVLLYTGDRPTNAPKTGVGFQPDLVFIKGRDQTDFWSVLDSTRGANVLSCDTTGAQSSFSGWSFDSDGFTIPSSGQANNNGTSYVAFCWRANGGTTVTNNNGSITSTVQASNASGFSIVKYDGSLVSGSTTTIGHGLSSPPELIILKVYEPGLTASSWFVYSSALTNYYELNLNNSNAVATDFNRWNNTAPTSSVFSVGSSFSSYPAYYGGDTIAYCFHSVSGFSKIGSYVGDGTTTKTITTGFQPDFVMIKVTSQADNWVILDSVRGGSKNVKPNSSVAEATESGTNVSFTSTGFQLIGSGAGLGQTNGSGKSYIYMAFKIP